MPKVMGYETLTPDDVKGRYAVIVKIRPVLPQEEMQRVQMAQAFRGPGVDGRPLMDDRTIIEDILEKDNPDAIERRIDAQMLPNESPDVKKALTAAREQVWFDENTTTMELVDKRLGKALEMRPEELEAYVALRIKMAMGAQGAQALLGQADAMSAGQPPMPGAPGQGPVDGMPPGVLPSQMQLTADPQMAGQQDPSALVASQSQRGRPQQPF